MVWIIFSLLLTGCSISINIVHVDGTASDVIDEEQSTKADPSLSIPPSVIL